MGSQHEFDSKERQAIGRVRRPGQLRDIHLYRFYVENSLDEDILSERQWKNLERYSNLTQIDAKNVIYEAAGDLPLTATWGKSTPCGRVPKEFADFFDASCLVAKNKKGLLRINTSRPRAAAKSKRPGKRLAVGNSERMKKRSKKAVSKKTTKRDDKDDDDFEPSAKRTI